MGSWIESCMQRYSIEMKMKTILRMGFFIDFYTLGLTFAWVMIHMAL